MSEEHTRHTWGNWVSRRAEFVGFRSTVDFAKAVGCTQATIRHWRSLRRPPRQMRRMLDVALLNALQTDRHTLFSTYEAADPVALPLLSPRLKASTVAGDSLKRQVQAIVELLDESHLRKLHDEGMSMLREPMTAA